MIVTSGGRFAGYGFYLLKGKPVFLWNLIDLKRVKWEGPDALTPGKHTLEFDFKYDGLGVGTLAFNNMSGLGRGGTGTLKVDGKEVATQNDGAHAAHDSAMGRELRHRLRHADRRERRGLPAAVPAHRQAQQADHQGGPPATVARGHQETRRKAKQQQQTPSDCVSVVKHAGRLPRGGPRIHGREMPNRKEIPPFFGKGQREVLAATQPWPCLFFVASRNLARRWRWGWRFIDG